MSEAYESMLWFPYMKRWAQLAQYREASLAARAIVDGAMTVFMGRGSLPATPEALRRAIGADEKEFSRGYAEASVCITILAPQWEEELADAMRRWETIRERNRTIAKNRKPRGANHKVNDSSTTGKPDGSPVVKPSVNDHETTSTSTDLDKSKSPKAPRSARSGEGLPEGFESFWAVFKSTYPRRPGQPWWSAPIR